MREIHPAANLFPLMTTQEFIGLRGDIAAHGLREAILIDGEGRVIDGRNRLQACEELGVEPRFRTFEGDSIVEMVMSLNLHRRHLNESQRALIGARAKPMFEEEAKARQGARTDISANLRGSDYGKASDQAARSVNVSPRSVESAAAVLKHGTPELVQRVEQGEIRVSAASTVARQPEPEQKRLAVLPLKELRQEIRKLDPRPSPAAARKLAMEQGVPVEANTGIMILPMPKEEEDLLGVAAVRTRNLYDAVRLVANCELAPEEFIAAAEKWTCLEMRDQVVRACDYLDKVIAAYARNQDLAVGY
jgi:ParB-like chromosome segregation protein Spo0J